MALFSCLVGFLALILLECAQCKPANLVMLESPGDAVCLDGTTPGYYYRQGIGNGTKGWIIHLEGGGWCYSEAECLERSYSKLGSSESWPHTADFSGFLSDNSSTNPDFYDWNVVYIKYCDGASFTGNV
jgi:hypothetical protein